MLKPMSERQSRLRQRLENLEDMPTVPVVLAPLLRYMEQPLDALQVEEVVDLISQDKSLAAQCLHMANSPLYGRWATVDNLRTAVVALGMQRVRDIALSCTLLALTPSRDGMDASVFWEHSLGCALVCRQFAQKIGFPDSAKAYLGGLLHDIGVVAELCVAPEQFQVAWDLARKAGIPLHEAEAETLGLTHCESGKILAEKWQLSEDLATVAHDHHDPGRATKHREMVALVSLSDLLCRMSGLGYGYAEERQINLAEQPGFGLLLEECPSLKLFDWARFTFELQAYMEEVHRLVGLLYRVPQ